jgi:stage II sporulation SpoAA-like protein
MIRTEVISANALKITVPERLEAEDVREIAPRIDALISEHGQIRLLIDASAFSGWENIATFEAHAKFIKSHHQKVERIAVIVAHDWQHWLIGAVRMFLHPEIRAFDISHGSEALQWIVGSAPTKVAA